MTAWSERIKYCLGAQASHSNRGTDPDMNLKRHDVERFLQFHHEKAIAEAAERIQKSVGPLQVRLELDFIEM